jgi:hypothetical protein
MKNDAVRVTFGTKTQLALEKERENRFLERVCSNDIPICLMNSLTSFFIVKQADRPFQYLAASRCDVCVGWLWLADEKMRQNKNNEDHKDISPRNFEILQTKRPIVIMGRKRRNAGAALKGDDNEASAAKLSDDAWGLLVTLLDLAGLFPRASDCFDGSHRQQLVRSIQQLAAELMRHNIDSKWNDHSVPLNAESSAHLRRIEDGIGQLRRDAESFLSNLATERMEVVETSHNFDECIGALQRSLVCWRAFAHSLLESYRAQSALEEGEVRNVLPLILDDVYTSTRGSPDAAFRLQGLAECLSRDAFLEKYNYREEVQMIRRVALQGHDPASIGKAATIESTTAPAKPMVRSPLSQIHADPNVVQAKTALSAVATFLRPRSSMDAQGTFTCILVVGSEGSGKTHLCNMAETMASASMPSTHSKSLRSTVDTINGSVSQLTWNLII